MKTLLLMRHAKSSWKDDALDDHERPLNKRGRDAAPKLGRLILGHRLLPDVVLCSTAVRARQTCQLVTHEWKRPVEINYLDELYLCPADRFASLLRRLSVDVECVLMIGHNPGMAEFLESTVGFSGKFPTGALAWLTADVPMWSDLAPHPVLELQNHWRPRDLD